MQNKTIDGNLNLSIETKGRGIVSAKYKEINELFTKKEF